MRKAKVKTVRSDGFPLQVQAGARPFAWLPEVRSFCRLLARYDAWRQEIGLPLRTAGPRRPRKTPGC